MSIPVISGIVEKDIRKGYYGGVVQVVQHKINDGYYYDMNSQYPKAMLNDMPTGKPIFTTETNLDNIFGFVYAHITAPDDNILKVPILPYRNDNDTTISQPRAEENNDSAQRLIAKLILNSLYGKMGQNNIDDYTKIIGIDQLNEPSMKIHDTDILMTGDTRCLVKIESSENFDKSRSLQSSVSIAAAITGYARIAINKFKNISGNNYSVVLEKPLESKYVGKELGQMKLEYFVKEGIFIKPKLYYINNGDGMEIIKAKGVGKNGLTYNDFIKLLNGESVDIIKQMFIRNNRDGYVKTLGLEVLMNQLNLI
ncbi:hypothetical protein BJ085DRAFT_43042 [Dimargaris cristalligena]|uniref:DNA-directed DNA polymerase n=1 Tax=Dimargaris cristalligena TaxID=215637 RepID=A0A4P9ZN05_9FUNG|nr:hypothetical protein BJ085DRAFT_43042 [Dimargaris cristalligena]|eukprot:RKP33912.1 hypothetical protein BJ085DRAFT_43042 [Dimargaris cristalligena]